MKNKELERIEHEGISYIIGVQFVDLLNTNIPYPFISVTTKSAKKNRSTKPSDKHQLHFNLLKIDKPITLFRKIYEIIETYLLDKDYVMFSANSDKQSKRETVYIKALESMGFLNHFYCNEDDIFMSRNSVSNKVKKKIINLMYEF